MWQTSISGVTWLGARFVAGLLLVHPVFGAFSICLAELCLRIEVRVRPPDYLVSSLRPPDYLVSSLRPLDYLVSSLT